ncbi:GL20797 [Drosophila persimilis]|uniref:GL20797 n=1 Tax=Drosophila persimilis TaxID=7234 RepID=B4H431_DROPE|nr:GL20797 [Drosophila persimilis]
MRQRKVWGEAPQLWLLLLLASVSCTLWASVTARTGPSHDKVVVCYISTWAVYRPEQGAYAIDNFDPNLCTHVVYAFAGLDITQASIKSLAANNVICQVYNVQTRSGYLDYLHIMCYAYHGSWDQKVGYNSPLAAPAEDPFSVKFTIDYLLKLGAPPSKLVLGLPFYGRTFKTVSEGNLNDGSDGVGFRGPYTREDGFLGYNEICNVLSNKTSGWTKQWDPQTSQVLARSERNVFTQDVSVVTFDSSRSIANKVLYAMSKRLAGVMVWSVDTDDFLGNCELDGDTFEDFKVVSSAPRRLSQSYPLLRTINEATVLALEQLAVPEPVPDDSENEIPHGSIADRKNAAASIVSLSLTATALFMLLHSLAH